MQNIVTLISTIIVYMYLYKYTQICIGTCEIILNVFATDPGFLNTF